MKYVLNFEKVIITEISNKTTILNIETEEIYKIRGTAIIIVDFIKKPKTLEEVIERVKSMFEDESIETVETKVKIFIKSLLEKDFINAVD